MVTMINKKDLKTLLLEQLRLCWYCHQQMKSQYSAFDIRY